MFDSLRNRILLALGVAVVGALAIVLLFSSTSERAGEKEKDAVGEWKRELGVDLRAFPQSATVASDSPDAVALEPVLQPLGVKLGAAERGGGYSEETPERRELRDWMREVVRATSTVAKPLPSAAGTLVERSATALDALAQFTAAHEQITWRLDFKPRGRSSLLRINDHLDLHRLLIARAFIALDRNDRATAAAMLNASQQLARPLAARPELMAQFVAVAVERMQLALMRRAGDTLGGILPAPNERVRERYATAMSGDAALILKIAQEGGLAADASDEVFRAVTGSKFQLEASKALLLAANGAGEILRASDPCAALAVKRRRAGGMFEELFEVLSATDAWHRFVTLELDRAMTAALLTGKASSPCPSVTLTVKETADSRTVSASGLPEATDAPVVLPASIETKLRR